LDGIPGLARDVAMKTMVRLAGLIEARSVSRKQPAVIAAADAFILDLAVEQRRAAVHAARIEETWPALAVAEQNQIFAEHLDLFWPRRGLFRGRHRLPVTPEQFAHRRARPDLGQELVGLRLLASIGGAGIGHANLRNVISLPE